MCLCSRCPAACGLRAVPAVEQRRPRRRRRARSRRRSHRLLGGDHFGRLALADDHAGQGRLPQHPDDPRRRRSVAEAWDPAKDEAAGEQCRAYGAPGLMRGPTRLHITWQDDNTLKLESDYGTQTRLFRFGGSPQSAQGARTWQGVSTGAVDHGGRRPRARRRAARIDEDRDHAAAAGDTCARTACPTAPTRSSPSTGTSTPKPTAIKYLVDHQRRRGRPRLSPGSVDHCDPFQEGTRRQQVRSLALRREILAFQEEPHERDRTQADSHHRLRPADGERPRVCPDRAHRIVRAN